MKDKIIKILKICQIILSIITFCMIFFAVSDEALGFVLANDLSFLPATFYIIFIVLFITDFILKKGAYRYLLIAYFVEILLFIYCLIQNDYILCNTAIMIVGIINAILTTISYIRLINNKYTALLPLGFFSTAHLCICYATVLFLIFAGTISYFLFDKYQINLAYLLIGIPLIFIIFLIVFVKANPLVRALKIINNKLDYEKFTKTLDKLFPNNLNQETRTYLEIVRANYLLVEDYEEAIKYYGNVGSVTNKTYLYFYAIVKCNFSSFTHNKKDFDDGLYILNNMTKKNLVQIEMSKAVWEIYNSNDEIANVEEIFNVNAAIPLSRLSNMVCLMNYYNTRGNREKALLYADELKKCPFKQYRKNAIDIIGDNNYEKEAFDN